MRDFKVSNITPSGGEITLHGIPYQDFDRTRHWSFWGITRLFENARLLMMIHTGIGDILFSPKSRTFLLKQIIQMNTNLVRKVRYMEQFEPKFTVKVLHIGNTSYSHVTRMYDKKTGDFYGECLVKSVHVDIKSRQPARLPAKFREIHSQHCDMEESPLLKKTEFGDIPEQVFKYCVKVLHSDMDLNNHTNQSVYVKFCIDCATDAALSGFYRHFKSDMCFHPVQQSSVQFVGESRSNMNLIVNTWQDIEDVCKIYFVITQEDGKHVFQAAFRFDKEGTKEDVVPYPRL